MLCTRCGFTYDEHFQECPFCNGNWEMLEFKVSPLPKEKMKEVIQSWIAQLPFPCVFEISANAEGANLRLFLEKGKGRGVVASWSALVQQQFRWEIKGTGAPRRQGGKVFVSNHEIPSTTSDLGMLYTLSGFLLEKSGQEENGESSLQIWLLGEDKKLQEDLRALSAYSYGTSGGVENNTLNPWTIRFRVGQFFVWFGILLAGIFGGLSVIRMIPLYAGLFGFLLGSTMMFSSSLMLFRWMRIRSVPKEILAKRAEETLLKVAVVYFGSGKGPNLFSGENRWKPLDSVYPQVKAFACSLPVSEIAVFLAPTPTSESGAVWNPSARQDIPYPPPSKAVVEAPFVIGKSPVDGQNIGIDPDGHSLVIGGSRTGKSSLAYQALKNLLEKGDNSPGVFLVDPHLSLADAFLDAIDQLPQPMRQNAVHRLRVITPDQPELVPLNMLMIPNFSWAANALIQVGKRIWEDYWGPRMQAALLGLFRVAHAWNTRNPKAIAKMGLIHTVFLAYSIRWRHDTIMQYLDPEERMAALALDALLGQMNGETMTPAQQGWTTEVISPVLSKVMALEISPWLYASMHQDSFANIERWIRERSYIVLRLPSGSMGRDAARLTASLVYNIFDSAYRATTEKSGAIPYWIVVDEIPEIANGMRLEAMLSEGGKFGARVFALSQSLSMMRSFPELEPVVQSLLANTSTQAFFSPDPDDAQIIRNALSAEERFGEVTADVPSLHAWLRCRIQGVWQPPTVVKIEPLARANPERVNALIREVIQTHPEDYLSPDGWRERVISSFSEVVPQSMRGLLGLALGESPTAPVSAPATSAPSAYTDNERLGF